MDSRRLVDKDPIWVDQQHLPLGGDVAQNLGRILVEDSIQCLGRSIGLVELDDLVGINIEALPVDDQIPGDLIDLGDGLIGNRNIDFATATKNDPLSNQDVNEQNRSGLTSRASDWDSDLTSRDG